MLSCRLVSPLQDLEDAHARVEEEFAREKAAALRRIGGRLEELISDLARHRRLAAGLEGEALERARQGFRRVREEAVRYRWYLEVQREAVGVRSHRHLDEVYPMPELLDP
ncbi:MAG: hypothetical protein LJF15_20805 [Acidobacteria bacterium]|nr:hypothetical protein [Acidobacteriota bacterium]